VHVNAPVKAIARRCARQRAANEAVHRSVTCLSQCLARELIEHEKGTVSSPRDDFGFVPVALRQLWNEGFLEPNRSPIPAEHATEKTPRAIENNGYAAGRR